MKEECLICQAPLEYLEADIPMECAICHKQESSKTRCVNGHYVCNECHSSGIHKIIPACLKETRKDPIAILETLMSMDFCHMHGPEHHILVGASLLTACKNAGGEIDLEKALPEMYNRGKNVPGGTCGFWGACGAGISTGIYLSILTHSTPLSTTTWGLSNAMTSRSLEEIGKNGGPRCCKRNSYLAIQEAVRFTKEHFGIEMELHEIRCTRSHMNNQCLGKNCKFHK